jgi:hypothetical protein
VRQQDLSNDIAPLGRIQIRVQVREADHAALEAIDRQFPFQMASVGNRELGKARTMRMTAAVMYEQGLPPPYAASQPFKIEDVDLEGRRFWSRWAPPVYATPTFRRSRGSGSVCFPSSGGMRARG